MPEADPRVVRVLPDVPALDRAFDYTVPAHLDASIRIGTIVRVVLNGRRVRGWVISDRADPPPGVKLAPVAKVTGWGPSSELIDLADWTAWRWAGRRVSVMRTASPDTAVTSIPTPAASAQIPEPVTPVSDELARQVEEAIRARAAVMRLAPSVDVFPVVHAMCRLGNCLVLAPTASSASRVASRLSRAGVPVALMPRGWAKARAGATVVGTRAAALAPMEDLAAVIVLDEHDESYQQEQTPTWHAREVVLERARRAGAPALLVSPTPSLEALAWGKLIVPSRSAERAGWPVVDVADRRREDPIRAGLYSPALERALRSGATVVCVINRKGRSKLLACRGCGEIARCDACGSRVSLDSAGELCCPSCSTVRPVVCTGCGRSAMKNIRAGVTRVREELESLARTRVVEVIAETDERQVEPARIYVGTEAVLHRVRRADVVAFLDFDQELLAPRYRAAEEALSLVVRAARFVGGRAGGGRVLIQTRIPGHEVIQAALHADPSRASRVERERREALRYPPFAHLAVVSGQAAPGFMAAFGAPAGIDVLGPSDGRWLLRSDDAASLADAIGATRRPGGRLRIAVDPMRF